MSVVEAEATTSQVERPTVFDRLGELLSARRLALGAAALLVVGLFSWNMVLRDDVAEDDRAVLMAENMPPVSEVKTFEIWVIEDDVPRPAGLFEPKADAVAITVEPEGGSPQPTTDPMLSAEL